MAALDFPDNPATGDLYGSSGTVWRWDGARWASTAGASGARGRVAYAQITASQSGIAAAVSIGGLAVTAPMQAGRTYKVTAEIQAYSSVATDVGEMALYNVDVAQSVQSAPIAYKAANSQEKLHLEFIVTPANTGTVTYHAQYRRAVGSGTHTVFAGPTYPAFILVEDITYEAGTSGGGGTPLLVGGRANRGASGGWTANAYTPVTWTIWDYLYQQAAGSGTIAFTLTPGVWSLGFRVITTVSMTQIDTRIYMGGGLNGYAYGRGVGVDASCAMTVTVFDSVPIVCEVQGNVAYGINGASLDARKISALPA